jgi:hypothetical protein
MKERVETNVKATYDFDSVPSDDGENDDEDSVDEDCLDLSLITNDELTSIILEDVEHGLTHIPNHQNKKEQETTKMDCVVQIFMLIEFNDDDISLWFFVPLLGRFWYG